MSSYYVERIQRGIDYVEAHLEEEVSLGRVAQAGGLSQWHFQRIFKSLTGETLKAYIRSRRLANTLDRLLNTELRILDIGIMAGFESQESFARAFKKAFGMAPSEYRQIKSRALFPKKLKLDEGALQHLQVHAPLGPELYHQPAMTLVGLRTAFHGVDSEKNNLGEKLPPLWASFLAARAGIPHALQAICYGVVQPDPEDGELLQYHAAVQVDALGPLPPGMSVVEVPAATYARFEHRGEAKAIDRTVSYAYSTWLLQSDRRHSYGPDLEFYGHRYHPTDPASVIEYAIPLQDP